MYKELFRIVISLVSKTGQTWKELAEKEEKGDEFLSRFVYPFIGLVTASAFVGVLLTEKEFHTEYALKLAIKALVSSFGGFHLAAWLLNELRKSIMKQYDNLRLCRRFVGYASAPMFAVYIVFSLIPLFPLLDFRLLRMLALYIYTAYIVWEGAPSYMHTTESGRMKFTVTATGLIILSPELIGGILFLLMPGMRI
ncbi:MAG: hypothetical protein LBP25_02575 [Tannerellaceae bacterium]|jgi:hypothetical protein|nr:hypothetical protein [Tannerellaceae bacterium]